MCSVYYFEKKPDAAHFFGENVVDSVYVAV